MTPGRHRIEVRLRGDGDDVDDIEGLDLDLSPRQRTTISLTVNPLTHRLKMKAEDEAGTGTRR